MIFLYSESKAVYFQVFQVFQLFIEDNKITLV